MCAVWGKKAKQNKAKQKRKKVILSLHLNLFLCAVGNCEKNLFMLPMTALHIDAYAAYASTQICINYFVSPLLCNGCKKDNNNNNNNGNNKMMFLCARRQDFNMFCHRKILCVFKIVFISEKKNRIIFFR